MGENLSEDDIDEMFEYADSDNDNEISYDEFLAQYGY